MTDLVRYRLSQGLLLLLAICYLLQVFSPLRLNGDAIVLLSTGEFAAHGGGFFDTGQKTVYPPGYPALLAVLMRVGLAHPWAIVGLNLVFLSVGLFAAYSLLIRQFFEDKAVVLLICSFFLLSFVVIKHSTIPLTDVPFFCCSMCCLAVISRATKMDWNWRFATLVGAAWLLAAAAITVRRIGVSLVPPLVFVIVCSPHFKPMLEYLSRRTNLIIVVVCVSVGLGTVYIVAQTSTLSDFYGAVNHSRISTLVLNIISYRFMEFGELFVNIPASKMPSNIHVIVSWIGFLPLLLMLVGLGMKRREIGPTEVFIISYMGILFVWPYADTRFRLPVIPLLIAYSVLAIKSFRLSSVIVTTYCIAFATLGFVAIGYSTRISFSGSTFPDRYGDGTLRPTYCAAFQSCRDGGNSNKVDAKALRLLRQYN